jgi:uncharacterized 2Fe-2S/4Fe-4S cluster protein (DUF4445 family)
MTCTVQIEEGAVPDASPADAQAFSERRLAEGWRRACETRPVGDCTIFIPPRSTAAPVRTQVDGQELEIEPTPAVRIHDFQLAAPSIEDHRSDDVRLAEALEGEWSGPIPVMDLALLKGLADNLRGWNWRGRAVLRGDELIAVGAPESRILGLAVDLGTTNISGFLVDLESGATLAAKGMENPQTSFGNDLIAYASLIRREPDKALTLQDLAAEAINQLARDLAVQCGRPVAEIVEMTVAGNTMMHHLLLGLPVKQLGMTPFVAALSEPIDIKAREIGIEIAPGGVVHFFANIAGFVGGDHVATLLATLEAGVDGKVIAMDIGTNTEISLIDGERITSISCPSGPAFEGGNISAGMRAAVGAIEMVHIRGSELRIETIEDAPAVGICGSGVMDAVAQLYLAGITDDRGRLTAEHPRVRVDETGKRAFLLASSEETGSGEDIEFTQDDIRGIQLAKAAIRSGIDLLLDATGHEEADLTQVIIAGAFGNYIDLGSALAVGMLPDLPFSRFAQVGNAAGDGARLALLCSERRQAAAEIARRCTYLELAGAPSFMKAFSRRINFRETRKIDV